MTDTVRNYNSPASGYKPEHGGYPQPQPEEQKREDDAS